MEAKSTELSIVKQFPPRFERDAVCVNHTEHQPAKRRRQLMGSVRHDISQSKL
jgi:hypothetical protein